MLILVSFWSPKVSFWSLLWLHLRGAPLLHVQWPSNSPAPDCAFFPLWLLSLALLVPMYTACALGPVPGRGGLPLPLLVIFKLKVFIVPGSGPCEVPVVPSVPAGLGGEPLRVSVTLTPSPLFLF